MFKLKTLNNSKPENQSYNNDVNDLGELNSVLFYVSSIRVSCSRETLLVRKIKAKFQFFYTADELNKSETGPVLLNDLLNYRKTEKTYYNYIT